MQARDAAVLDNPAWGMDALAQASPQAVPALWFENWFQGASQLAPISEAVLVLGPVNQGPFAPVARYPGEGPSSVALMQACEQSLALVTTVLRAGESTIWAVPLIHQGDLLGVLGLTLGAHQLPTRMSAWTQWGLAWLVPACKTPEEPVVEGLVSMVDLILLAQKPGHHGDAIQALLIELSHRLGCERVSLGFSHALRPHKVWRISHAPDFSRRLELAALIGECMDEAADEGLPMSWPSEFLPSSDAQTTALAYGRLSTLSGAGLVLSVPFVPEPGVRGAMVFEWREAIKAKPLMSMLLGMVPAVAAASYQRYQQQRPWPVRALHGLFGQVGQRQWRLLGLGAVAALFAGLSLWQAPFQVPAQAEIEGLMRRQLVAPFDGYVAAAHHRAGESVRAGTVLATLDDRDLRLEADRWRSQRQQYASQMQDAEAQKDRAQYQINLAQAKQADAQRALSESMVQRSSIAAPFDGYIVQGDLSQQLGAAIRKGQSLFELAPLNQYRVALQIDEADMAHVRPGQKGTLMLTALPGQTFDVEVYSVTSVAEVKEGKNHFRVEAHLRLRSDQGLDSLRPAMQGVARLDVEQASQLWIWTRPMREWLRLKFWVWLGW